MPGRKFGHNSPYDESGMPLGTETADYDNADEVRMKMVKSTYEEPIPLNDPEYQPRQLTKKETGMDRNHGLPHGNKGFNSAIPEGVNISGYDLDPETVDIEDPAERRRLLVQEAEDKGFELTPELPKVEKQEVIDEVKESAVNDSDVSSFEALLQAQKPEPGVPTDKEQSLTSDTPVEDPQNKDAQ